MIPAHNKSVTNFDPKKPSKRNDCPMPSDYPCNCGGERAKTVRGLHDEHFIHYVTNDDTIKNFWKFNNTKAQILDLLGAHYGTKVFEGFFKNKITPFYTK